MNVCSPCPYRGKGSAFVGWSRGTQLDRSEALKFIPRANHRALARLLHGRVQAIIREEGHTSVASFIPTGCTTTNLIRRRCFAVHAKVCSISIAFAVLCRTMWTPARHARARVHSATGLPYPRGPSGCVVGHIMCTHIQFKLTFRFFLLPYSTAFSYRLRIGLHSLHQKTFNINLIPRTHLKYIAGQRSFGSTHHIFLSLPLTAPYHFFLHFELLIK